MTTASQLRNAFIWRIIAVLGALAIPAPFILKIEIENGGGALILGGITMAIIGFVVSRTYSKRAQVLAQLTDPANILAEWDTGEDFGKAVITNDGLVAFDEIYTFKDYSCKLEKLELKPTDGSGKLLFHLVVPGRYSDTRFQVEIPVPKGESGKARQIADHLRQKFSLPA